MDATGHRIWEVLESHGRKNVDQEI